jgi:hypothetical protein
VLGYSNRLKGQWTREELEEHLGYVPRKLKRNDGKYLDNHDNNLNLCVCGHGCASVKPICPEQFKAAMEKGDLEGRKECLEFSPSVVTPLLKKFPRTEDALKQSVNFLDCQNEESDDESDHERDEESVSFTMILTHLGTN